MNAHLHNVFVPGLSSQEAVDGARTAICDLIKRAQIQPVDAILAVKIFVLHVYFAIENVRLVNQALFPKPGTHTTP